MKIVIVGDVHFRAKKLKDISESWARTVAWSKKKEVDIILQAGDVFDKPNIYGREADVGTIFSSFLKPFNNPFCDMVLIPGNHDMGGPRDVDALAAFDSHSWIKIIHKPNVVSVKDGLSICAVPWVNRAQLLAKLIDKGMSLKDSKEKVDEAMSGLLGRLKESVQEHQNNGQFVVLLGHLEVTGAKCEGGGIQSGGTFEFSSKSLVDVGADAYALGHIHSRQWVEGFPNENDGYLGTLCQLGYGEEGNDTGFRFLEIENRNIKIDKFINNSKSPKYFTIEDVEKLELSEGNYIKLRGEDRPDSLPEGIQFERIPPKAETIRRTEKKLDIDTPLEELIKVWAKQEKCDTPIGELLTAAKEVESQTKIKVASIGSLERIDRMFLNNIGSHKKTEIDLSGINGICGLEGATGSGKTTLLESFLVSFFGHCPSRPSLQSIIRDQDDVKDALIEVDIITSGKKVTARREFKKTDKTFSHKAYLFEQGSKEALAGPKVDNVNKVSSNLIGDLGTILSGVFSAQDEVTNIVNLDRSKRMDLFAKLLGTDIYIAMGKVAEKIIKTDNTNIEILKSKSSTLRIDLSSEKDANKNLQKTRSSIINVKQEIRNHEKNIASLQTSQSEVEASIRNAAEANSRIAKLENRKLKIDTDKEELEKYKSELVDIDLNVLKDKLSELRKKSIELVKMNRKTLETEKLSSNLIQKSIKLKGKSDNIRATRIKEFSDYRTEIFTKEKTYKKSRETKKNAILEKMDGLKKEETLASEKLNQAKKRHEILKGFPDLKECQSCPIAKEGIEERKKIPDLTRSFKRLRERLRKGQDVLERYNEETEANEKNIVSVIPAEDKWNTEMLDEIKYLEDESLKLSKESEKTTVSNKHKEICNLLSLETRDIPAIEEKIEKSIEVQLKIAKIQEKMISITQEYIRIKKELEEIIVPEVIKEDFVDKIKREKERKENTQIKLDDFMVELGKIQASIELVEKRKIALQQVNKDILKYENRTRGLLSISKAFSRNGIPQLIVDSTIPHLQDIMSNLMSDFSGGFSIRIKSQRETKGEIKEVIDIMVSSGQRERDIRTYSGGEKQLLKTIIRIAFATLQAERSGKGLKVLVLDEATDAMDPDLSESFISMLGKLSASFNQVFVVSHNDYVFSALNNRIICSKDGDETKVILIYT